MRNAPGSQGRSLYATLRHYSLESQSDASGARLNQEHVAVMFYQSNQLKPEFLSR
jgi:hypothetical protein